MLDTPLVQSALQARSARNQMLRFGHVPELGETVEIESLRFEVLNADSRRLRLLRVDTPEPIHHDSQT